MIRYILCFMLCITVNAFAGESAASAFTNPTSVVAALNKARSFDDFKALWNEAANWPITKEKPKLVRKIFATQAGTFPALRDLIDAGQLATTAFGELIPLKHEAAAPQSREPSASELLTDQELKKLLAEVSEAIASTKDADLIVMLQVVLNMLDDVSKKLAAIKDIGDSERVVQEAQLAMVKCRNILDQYRFEELDKERMQFMQEFERLKDIARTGDGAVIGRLRELVLAVTGKKVLGWDIFDDFDLRNFNSEIDNIAYEIKRAEESKKAAELDDKIRRAKLLMDLFYEAEMTSNPKIVGKLVEEISNLSSGTSIFDEATVAGYRTRLDNLLDRIERQKSEHARPVYGEAGPADAPRERRVVPVIPVAPPPPAPAPAPASRRERSPEVQQRIAELEHNISVNRNVLKSKQPGTKQYDIYSKAITEQEAELERLKSL